jgi:hypothetical protein
MKYKFYISSDYYHRFDFKFRFPSLFLLELQFYFKKYSLKPLRCLYLHKQAPNAQKYGFFVRIYTGIWTISVSKTLKIYEEITSSHKSSGNKFIGFIHLDEKNGFSEQLKQQLPHLGEYKDLKEIVHTHQIEEIIKQLEHDRLKRKLSLANTL